MTSSSELQLNFVLGTAAELIKVYPLIKLAGERGHKVRVISTGQSRENFLAQYKDLDLNEAQLVTMLSSDGDLRRTSSALKWFARALFVRKKTFRSRLVLGLRSYVVVHGDTLSTLVGAFLARRAGIPVVHVEAGLRSPSLLNPFPEEITRRLVSRLARKHLAPDELATDNLRRARVKGEVVNTGGNTLLDAIRLSSAWPSGALAPTHEPFVLVNIHRFENLNSAVRWQFVVALLGEVARTRKLIFIMHPQTRHKLMQDTHAQAMLNAPNIEMRDRLPFSEFVRLLKNSEFLISDGGSNQEECSYLGKPCLILRERTERKEGLDTCCVLSAFDQKIADNFLRDPRRFQCAPLSESVSPSTTSLDYLERH